MHIPHWQEVLPVSELPSLWPQHQPAGRWYSPVQSAEEFLVRGCSAFFPSPSPPIASLFSRRIGRRQTPAPFLFSAPPPNCFCQDLPKTPSGSSPGGWWPGPWEKPCTKPPRESFPDPQNPRTLPPRPHLLCLLNSSSDLGTYPAPGPPCLNRLV